MLLNPDLEIGGNHSTYLYLIDPVGRVRHLFRHEDPPEVITELTAYLASSDDCHPEP